MEMCSRDNSVALRLNEDQFVFSNMRGILAATVNDIVKYHRHRIVAGPQQVVRKSAQEHRCHLNGGRGSDGTSDRDAHSGIF
jgi:hypothetical protein